MTDIQSMRAQLRDSRASPVRVSSSGGGGGGMPFWAIAAGAAVVGFGVVLMAPRFFTAQRTAALPDFQEAARAKSAGGHSEQQAAAPLAPAQSAPTVATPPAKAPPAQGPASRYAGKAPEDVVRISDAVCEHRAEAVRSGVQPAPRSPGQRDAPGRPGGEEGGSRHKVTAADEKLYCLLTEVPARFCTPNQKRKVTADIINYFKGIEYTNAAVAVAAKVAAMKGDGARAPSGEALLNKAEIDPRVVEAFEALLRAGYLTRAHREEIGANVPLDLKERFARIVGSTPSCPKPPWWASFL